MNICNAVHEDYFNDATVYMNLLEKQFSVRCNRPPCTRKPWKWQRMSETNWIRREFLSKDSLISILPHSNIYRGERDILSSKLSMLVDKDKCFLHSESYSHMWLLHFLLRTALTPALALPLAGFRSRCLSARSVWLLPSVWVDERETVPITFRKDRLKRRLGCSCFLCASQGGMAWSSGHNWFDQPCWSIHRLDPHSGTNWRSVEHAHRMFSVVCFAISSNWFSQVLGAIRDDYDQIYLYPFVKLSMRTCRRQSDVTTKTKWLSNFHR